MAFLPLLAHAFSGEVEIDGINYFIKTGAQIAEVRAKYPNYSGDVVIPPTVDYDGVTCNVILIADNAFYGCTSLASVTIPNSVTSIGVHAFSYCTSLTSITIPNSVVSIGGMAFYFCTRLTSITIPNSITSIGGSAFSGCISLTSVTIPSSVTSIGESIFSGCTSLASITIPNSVTSIGGCAFSGCTNLTSVTIGSGVSIIAYQTFANCPSIEDVYCYAVNVPYTHTSAFEDSYPENATLHVPDESVNNYRNHYIWGEFGTIIGLSETSIGQPLNSVAEPSDFYSLDGQCTEQPRKGVNIVRMSDGTVKKVVIK